MPATIALTPLSPEEAKRLIAAGATLVDIREPDEFARERIPGARNQPATILAAGPHCDHTGLAKNVAMRSRD